MGFMVGIKFTLKPVKGKTGKRRRERKTKAVPKREFPNTQRVLVPKKLTREELNSLVDRAADLIRTAVDYKFILVLLFLKRLNDVWKEERRKTVDRLVREFGFSLKEAEEEADRPEGRLDA
jgi:type I restriction-modification system DNA methylase subunit